MSAPRTLCGASLLLAGCAVLPQESPADQLDLVRASVRADAQARFGQECGTVTIPDRAFVPVEITGGGAIEYAVRFGYAKCGGSSTRWAGTGGGAVEFWSAEGGRPHRLFERTMQGFTPTADGFVARHHGASCEGGYGPVPCEITYRWDPRRRTFEIVSKRLWDREEPPPVAVPTA